jgi:hypothetical protein
VEREKRNVLYIDPELVLVGVDIGVQTFHLAPCLRTGLVYLAIPRSLLQGGLFSENVRFLVTPSVCSDRNHLCRHLFAY